MLVFVAWQGSTMEDTLFRVTRSVVLSIVIASALLASMKIISLGYMPGDDALRHAAKVVSGRTWDDILVLRPEMTTDRHEGWHVFLTAMYRLTHLSKENLVVFSVVFLALLFLLAPVPWLSRPEVWPIVIAFAGVAAPSTIGRLFLGRPYIFTMAVLLTICFLWPRLKSSRLPIGSASLLLVLVALSTWIHGVPHLYVLPVAAFLLAREWRAAAYLAGLIGLGCFLGASLTGHPIRFIWEGLLVSSWAFAGRPLPQMLVAEFQPYSGEGVFLVGILLALLWRRVRGEWNAAQLLKDPVFMILCLGWILGFSVYRFWSDWGFVAGLAWMAKELDDLAERYLPVASTRRIVTALAGGLCLFAILSSDMGGRWTWSLTKQYLSLSDPQQREWLPEPGGIVYSDSYYVFYDTFYANPKGPWRYILGFEAALMPEPDFKIFRATQWNFGAGPSFSGWVAKMKPADRLILIRNTGAPDVAGLEWGLAARNLWVGRLPRAKPSQETANRNSAMPVAQALDQLTAKEPSSR